MQFSLDLVVLLLLLKYLKMVSEVVLRRRISQHPHHIPDMQLMVAFLSKASQLRETEFCFKKPLRWAESNAKLLYLT